MAKSRDAFRTISEVSDVLETPAHVLRFWESKFSQIKPVKRAGGRRYYRPDDVSLLAGIKHLLHDDGMTIKGAQKLLRDKGVKHVISIGEGLDAPVQTMPQSHLEVAPDVTAKTVADMLAAEDAAQVDMFSDTGDADANTQAAPTDDDAKPRLQSISASLVAEIPEPEQAPIDAAPDVTDRGDDEGDGFAELDIPRAAAPDADANTAADAPFAALSPFAKPDTHLPANPAPRSDLHARCLAAAVRADPARITANAAEIAPLLNRLTQLRDEMRHPW